MSTATMLVRAGIRAGWIEFKQAFSGVEAVGQLIWPVATLGALYVFRDRSIDASGVPLGTVMFPGVLGMFVAFGMLLVVQALASDKEDGTLLRAKATPGGVPTYLIGKLVTASLTVVIYLLVIAAVGGSFLRGLETGSPTSLFTMLWVIGLGLIATQLLGAALGSLVTGARAAGYLGLLVMAMVVVSGIFYPLSAMPTWAQWLGQATPMYWLGLGMRSAMLPAAAATYEISGSWRPLTTLAMLGTWALIGLLVTPAVLGRMARRRSGSRIGTPHIG